MKKEDIKDVIDAMKEVFPTAEMINNSFQATQDLIHNVASDVQTVKADIAEVRVDLDQLTNTVEDLRERVNNVPTMPDMERLLEKTYNLATLQIEHDRMKKIIQEKLGVEI